VLNLGLYVTADVVVEEFVVVVDAVDLISYRGGRYVTQFHSRTRDGSVVAVRRVGHFAEHR
jgi:hypothetical protein